MTPPYADFSQLAIKRSHGKWSAVMPVKREWYHPGNGSSGEEILLFSVYDNEIPARFLTQEEPFRLEGWLHWDAKDFFKLADSEAVLCQYDYFIGIERYDPTNAGGTTFYDIQIPVCIDEHIVAISFPGKALTTQLP
jgi:hypothetical protein